MTDRSDAARHLPTRLRPRHHPFRSRQQLRASVRGGGGELRAVLATDFAPHRDELVISTKAGYDMWPGPYGESGHASTCSLRSTSRCAGLGLDYVDIFYSHRFDPDTPLDETMGALAARSRRAKPCTSGSRRTPRLARVERRAAAEHEVPLLIHQPSYSMFNRWTRARPAARHARNGRRRLHRLLPARAGPAHRPLPARHPGRLRVATGGACPAPITEERLANVRALAASPNVADRASLSSRWRGPSATLG